MKVYQQIASTFAAFINCRDGATLNSEWLMRHSDKIREIVGDKLPSGSGFNNGTQFDFEESKPERLVFNTAFHHMNANGYYDGWTTHKVIVTPSLAHGFDMRVTGRDRNQIKEYIGYTIHHALNAELD